MALKKLESPGVWFLKPGMITSEFGKLALKSPWNSYIGA